jgi:hypothetical protein
MVLPADYQFLDVLWTMILFFCWVAWLWQLILIFPDLFQRDASGRAKAAWDVFVILLPFLGALRRYVPPVATSSDGAAEGEIKRGNQLLDSGVITPQVFDQLKAKALA